jgi:hypothetical protein
LTEIETPRGVSTLATFPRNSPKKEVRFPFRIEIQQEFNAMSTVPTTDLTNPLSLELHSLRDRWGTLLVLGIIMIVLGMLALGSEFIAT